MGRVQVILIIYPRLREEKEYVFLNLFTENKN
jgi:hypothetical protein